VTAEIRTAAIQLVTAKAHGAAQVEAARAKTHLIDNISQED
jgi:hypothetical protein